MISQEISDIPLKEQNDLSNESIRIARYHDDLGMTIRFLYEGNKIIRRAVT